MILENIERYHQFNCQPDQTIHRRPGLSALLRVHNEAVWIGACLESIVDWFDEIVVCLNRCSDDTGAIVARFEADHLDKFKVFDYPFKIHEMGPRHSRCPANSVHASAYYYNFCQAQSTRNLVCKVDGDMVFQDWAGAEIRRLIAAGHERIKFEGVDIVGDNIAHIGDHPRCPTNGVYRVAKGVRYAQGDMTQKIQNLPPPTIELNTPAFLHFKWSRKPFASATVQWPEDWQSMPHFQRIAERRFAVAPYRGDYPASVRRMMKGGTNESHAA